MFEKPETCLEFPDRLFRKDEDPGTGDTIPGAILLGVYSVKFLEESFVMLEGTVTFSVHGGEFSGGVGFFREGRLGSESEDAFLEQQLLKQQSNRHKPATRIRKRANTDWTLERTALGKLRLRIGEETKGGREVAFVAPRAT